VTAPRDGGPPGPSGFDERRFARIVAERGLGLGWPLAAVALTGSTNDDALAAARAGAPHGATFVADAQTRGRGRRGHGWTSPPGENLTFSVLLRPALAAARSSALTLAVGLAVRDAAAARVGVPVGLKWPNDVVAAGRKLGGILLESQLRGDRVAAVVAGVGLNVAMREIPPEIAGIATSLALLGAEDPGREELLASVLAQIERRLGDYEASGLATMLDELRRHDALLGSRVRVDAVEGVARGIDAQGALLVEQANGATCAVMAGEVVTER
jgi:BirA family biotin operon repressor/biotin-[acetyl-CoA-carboxylase] ligase